MRRTELIGMIMGPVFLALAAWFLWGPEPSLPSMDAVAVSSDQFGTEPLREVLTDPPTILHGAYEQTCRECHKLRVTEPETPRRLFEHTHIVLDHGLNDRCLNCHDREDRNLLALRGTEKIPYAEVPRLCAKCHGPTYRDWQKGMHGKTLGYWDESHGTKRKLLCTHCHDPHAPAIGQMTLLPGPHTLRMLEPEDHPHHGEESSLNPLQHWRRGMPGLSEGTDHDTGKEGG